MHTAITRRRAVWAAGLILAAAVAGHAVTAATTEAAVTIMGHAFMPAQVTVPVGGRVVWANQDDTPHTVTSSASPRLFGSEALDTGEHFARVFDKAGTYRYFCALHPFMQGVVVVR